MTEEINDSSAAESASVPWQPGQTVTRRQRFLSAALKNVRDVKDQHPDSTNLHKQYGGLCHTLPILVRVDGLCQALAFVEDKAKAGEAQRLILQHVAELFGDASDPLARERLLEKVRDASLTEYMVLTRRLLEAWVFYKRFAVSILNVKDATDAEVTADGEAVTDETAASTPDAAP